jgi:hypothetical protein
MRCQSNDPISIEPLRSGMVHACKSKITYESRCRCYPGTPCNRQGHRRSRGCRWGTRSLKQQEGLDGQSPGAVLAVQYRHPAATTSCRPSQLLPNFVRSAAPRPKPARPLWCLGLAGKGVLTHAVERPERYDPEQLGELHNKQTCHVISIFPHFPPVSRRSFPTIVRRDEESVTKYRFVGFRVPRTDTANVHG